MHLGDVEGGDGVGEVAFELCGFDSSLVGEVFAVVPEPADHFGEVVVELAAGVEVVDDFFVFRVGVF